MLDIKERLRKIENEIAHLRDAIQREEMQRLLHRQELEIEIEVEIEVEVDVISNHDRSY